MKKPIKININLNQKTSKSNKVQNEQTVVKKHHEASKAKIENKNILNINIQKDKYNT